MTRIKDPFAWLWGLLAGAIGGGATSVSSIAGTALAKTVGMDIQLLDARQAAVVFISGAICSAAAYLKQSPLPKIETTDTTIITKPKDI